MALSFYGLDFLSSKGNVSKHIKNIYNEGELEESSTVREFRIVRREGNRDVSRNIKHYNLDMIIPTTHSLQNYLLERIFM